MSCTHCNHAQTDPIWPGYQAACRGCSIRALANGLAFYQASTENRVTPEYKAALQATLGPDWKTSHSQVKKEADRLKALKGGLK